MITMECSEFHSSVKIVLTRFEAEKLLEGLSRRNIIHIRLRKELEKLFPKEQP